MEGFDNFLAKDSYYDNKCQAYLASLKLPEVQQFFIELLDKKNYKVAEKCLPYLNKTVNFGNSYRNQKEETINPLIRAAHSGNLETVKFLIKHGADPNFLTKTAIMFAYEEKHIEIVKYLYDNGAKTIVDKIKMTSFTPSFYGSEKELIGNLIDFLDDKIQRLKEKKDFDEW